MESYFENGIEFFSSNDENTKKKGLNYLIKASDLGHKHATVLVGYAYEDGDGVECDFFKAIEFYKKAIDMGYSLGYEGLASMYHSGNLVEQSNRKTYEYYSKSNSRLANFNKELLELYFYDEIKDLIEEE